MEDKDPKDDELNQEGQDDINDADDSFGLPDLDYKPLEESEEGAESEETAGTGYEDDTPDDSAEAEEESASEQPERRFSAYREQQSSSNGPKIIIAIVAILVIAAGVWYFGFYGPAEAERAKVEQAEALRAEKQRQEELAAQRRQQEEEAATQVTDEPEDHSAPVEEVTERGRITTISAPSSRYYVVIGSFIDVDLAMDLGKELAAKGVSTTLISPYSKKKLYRLAVANYGSSAEASSAANDLKAEYGENLWVLKY